MQHAVVFLWEVGAVSENVLSVGKMVDSENYRLELDADGNGGSCSQADTKLGETNPVEGSLSVWMLVRLDQRKFVLRQCCKNMQPWNLWSKSQ